MIKQDKRRFKEMKDSNSNRGIIWTMAGIILILVLVLLYFFVFSPQYDNFVNDKRLEGIDLYIAQIMLPSIQQNGFMQVPLGNQSLILAAVSPEELQFLAQIRQQQAAAQQAPQTGTQEVQATEQ